jgi:hypothetical protein
MGAKAKVSSIHVNTWFGDYDKVKMAKLFMSDILKEDNIKETTIFFGDSPNDEPMFKYFPNSCAVANINEFLNDITYLPSYVTSEKSGLGFANALEYIINLGREKC